METEIIAVEFSGYEAILSKMHSALSYANHIGQAQVIDNLLKLLCQKNFESFVKDINSVSMWGGAGAVWEVYIEDKNVACEFYCEMIKLIDLMKRTKVIPPIMEYRLNQNIVFFKKIITQNT